MIPPILSVTRYLVVKQLAGKTNIVMAILDYFDKIESPSSLAAKYGMSKHQIRGYVQRIMEKCGSFARSRAMVLAIAPLVLRLRPIIYSDGGKGYRCRLCGDSFVLDDREAHVERIHSDYVDDAIYAVIEKARSMILNGKKMEVIAR